MLSLSSIACIVEICLPLGATRGRLGRLVLNSEASLPPVSILCEEFDCVPAAGATACPEKENALSLLSCSVICKARGYPLVGSVGVLRLITCESEVISPIMCCCLILRLMFSTTTTRELQFQHGGVFLLAPAVILSQRSKLMHPLAVDN